MSEFKRSLQVVLAIGLIATLLVGCASQVALFRGGTSKSFDLQSADYNTAFTKVFDAAQKTGYSVIRNDKEKGTFYLSRGYGYSEFTNMEIRVAKTESGVLRLDLVVSSSQDGNAIINEFVEVYRQDVPIKLFIGL